DTVGQQARGVQELPGCLVGRAGELGVTLHRLVKQGEALRYLKIFLVDGRLVYPHPYWQLGHSEDPVTIQAAPPKLYSVFLQSIVLLIKPLRREYHDAVAPPEKSIANDQRVERSFGSGARKVGILVRLRDRARHHLTDREEVVQSI